MNRVLLCLLLVSLSGLSQAQKSFILSYQPKNGFVHLSVGPAIPVGDFANQSATTDGAGLALKGLTTQLSVGYRLLGPIGLMARFEQSQFGVQTAGLSERQLSQDSTYNRQATASNWQTTSLLIGPYISIPMGRFSVDLRVLIGQTQATCPHVTLTGDISPDEMVSLETRQNTASASATSMGLSVKYRLGRSLAVQVNGDYNQTNVPFQNMTTVWQQGSRRQDYQFDSQQQINTVNISGGITWLFGNRKRVF